MKPSTPTREGSPPAVAFGGELLAGRFERRLNRFLARIRLERGESVEAHVPNTGRMGELLVPGAQVALEPKAPAGRKSAYDLVLAWGGAAWVCVDSRRANEVFEALLRSLEGDGLVGVGGRPPTFLLRCARHRREVREGPHRFDFELEAGGARALVEVKSVNLAVDRTALFPDAPTARGARQVELLASLARKGRRGMVAFVVLRSDADRLRPNEAMDPGFAEALRRAKRAGVKLFSLGCEVSPQGIVANRFLPVHVD